LTLEGHFEGNVELRTKNEERAATSAVPSSSFYALSSALIPFSPGQEYFLGCPDCGAELDRTRPEWHPLAPERAAQRKWSYRLSQLLFPDIDLGQIVAAWQLAIRDPAHMNVFCTDRLALPKSSSQTLTPHDLQAARGNYRLGILTELRGATELTEGEGAPNLERINGIGMIGKGTPILTGGHEADEGQEGRNLDGINGIRMMGDEPTKAEQIPSLPPSCSSSASCPPVKNPVPSPNQNNRVNPVQKTVCFGGLDLGDQCWFVARGVEARAPHLARLVWIEAISAERVRTRVPELFRELKLAALCVDAGPLRDLSRDLTFLLNEIDEDAAVTTDDPARNIFFSRDGATLPLRWQASAESWQGVRCAPVEFTQREGQGLRHKVARTQDGRIYPLLAAHRDETIQRVITELLPASAERPRLVEAADGTARAAAGPRFLLPTATDETRGVLDLYERHLLAGARQERSGDGKTLRYLDKCENHFLLATAYAALAELLAPARARASEPSSRLPAFRALPGRRLHPGRAVIG